MIWEKIANDHSTLQGYRLTDNNNNKLILKYNPLHHSTRITFGNSHRLFFMLSAGSLSGKTVFTNEYGLETGNLIFENQANKAGGLTIDGKIYHFRVDSNKITIFEKNELQPLAVCELGSNTVSSTGILSKIDISCYVLGACWYLFLPFTKRVIIQYATAS